MVAERGDLALYNPRKLLTGDAVSAWDML